MASSVLFAQAHVQTPADAFFHVMSQNWLVVAIIAYAVYAVMGLIMGAVKSAVLGHREMELKQALMERGFSAGEIVQVVAATRADDGRVTQLPCASEVVVESDGDWLPALVLKVAADRYYVHYVDHGMDDNEWVESARIRFPAGSTIAESASREKPPALAEL